MDKSLVCRRPANPGGNINYPSQVVAPTDVPGLTHVQTCSVATARPTEGPVASRDCLPAPLEGGSMRHSRPLLDRLPFGQISTAFGDEQRFGFRQFLVDPLDQ